MNKRITIFPTSPPIVLSWEDEAPSARPRLLTEGDNFLCAQCGAEITSASLRVAVDGSHRHLLPRSFGLDQEHGCFSLAPGCIVHSPLRHLLWDREASGGEWHMVSCATCGNHMGWYYRRQDGPGFFLLILEHLRAAGELSGEPENPKRP